MAAYYNEIDLYAAQWLRELIAEGLIADGHVDTRSIGDVTPNDLRGYTQHHFFAGIGGWSLALRLAAWPDHRPVWTGSCPCQPFSLAGRQGGFADERHLWPFWHHLIAQCRPSVVLGEQVASASKWLGLVRGDLEALDYAVGAIPVEAASAGADHLRDRYWFVGHHQGDRRGEGWTEHAVRSGWDAAASDGGMEHAAGIAEREQDNESDTFADGREARSVPCGASTDGSAIYVGDASGSRLAFRPITEIERGDIRREGAPVAAPSHRSNGAVSDASSEQAWSAGQSRQYERMEWVIGADGKARRVKSGVRLLADGFPGRVGLLRGFGNAIDTRPAAAFIRATMDILPLCS